jgi:RHS repeat-associated protein
MLSLGEEFALQGAVSLAEIFVSIDLATDTTQPVVKLVAANLADKWWIDQIVRNKVTVTFLDGTHVFVKQPDGTYTAPAKHPATLSLISGTYRLTTPQGEQFNFGANGTITSFVTPAGVSVTYTYTTGLLTSITNGLGRTLTLNYTSGKLTSVSDGNGRSVQYGFDVNGNLTSFTDAESKATTYVYDQPGRMTQYFKPANPTTPVVTNVYDSLDRVKTQANARNQITTMYFAGSRTETVDPLSHSSVMYFSRFGDVIRSVNALGLSSTVVFDGLQRATEMTLPEGNKVQFTYNANNQTLVQTFVAKPGSGLSNIQISFTYDATWAKVKTAVDANGNTTTFGYDVANGNLLTVTRPVVGGLTPVVTNTYNSRGQILTTTDETGIVTKFTYDASTEKLTSLVVDYSIGGGHLNLTSSFGYDSVGNLTTLTDFNGNQSIVSFDNERRPTQKTDPAPFSYMTKLGYDANSNLTSVQKQVTSLPTWQTGTISYSATDKKTSSTDPLGKITTWVYDGADRLQAITDAQGRTYQSGFDALDRNITVTDPSTTVCDTRTFTDNGLLKTRKDARNNVTQYTYDGFDRLSKVTYADSSTEQYSSYDANGNVLTFVTRSGNSITAQYDALNRVNLRTPTGQATVSFAYDLAGRLTSSSKPTVVGDPSTGTFQFNFDSAGRFYQEVYPDSKSVTHVLDANGNRTKTTWPDGYFINRSFDQLNRLTNIYLNGSGSSSVAFTYDQLSRRDSITLGNGAVTTYSYAANNDVVSLQQVFVGSSVNFSYGYDNVHELTSSNASDNSYTWHPASAGTVSYGSADSVNKYPSVGGVGCSYDGNKNLAGDGTWSYTYDTDNHLLSATTTGTTANYVYDPMHRQAQKTVGPALTRFIYDGNNRIADYDGSSGTLLNRYVNVGIDEPIIQIAAGGTVSFFHQDRQNSVISHTNSSGAIVNKYSYSPFGESASVSSSGFGYTGQRYDSETGLYYYKARYYSPKLGRFLQCDPIGYEGGDLNLYAYVRNAPLNFRDPLGLEPTFSAGTVSGIPVSRLTGLASNTPGYYDGYNLAQSGLPLPQERGGIVTTTGLFPNAPSVYQGEVNGDHQFLGGGQLAYAALLLAALAVGSASGTYASKNIVVGIGVGSTVAVFAVGFPAVLVHTHQVGIPGTDPYLFSSSDLDTSSKAAIFGIPSIVVVQASSTTSRPVIMLKLPGSSNSRFADAYMDYSGNWHQSYVSGKDSHGNDLYSSVIKPTAYKDIKKVGEAKGPCN